MEPQEVFAGGRDRIDVGLFLATLAAIGKETGTFTMRYFEAAGACRTFRCFAGTCNAIVGNSNTPAAHAANRAQASLGLTADEALSLFYTNGWPREFLDAIRTSRPGTQEYFDIAESRFLHFLKTGN